MQAGVEDNRETVRFLVFTDLMSRQDSYAREKDNVEGGSPGDLQEKHHLGVVKSG